MTREEKLQAIREKCALARNPTATRSEIARYTISKQFGLCDVLLAIITKDSANRTRVIVESSGQFIHWTPEGGSQLKEYWNLRKDSLTDQSPETIDFLYQLLCEK